LRQYRPAEYDVTLTCNYPFSNWALRRPLSYKSLPPHVFVTENGDWPAQATNSEFRFFSCDGLVCTNPEFYERNRRRWRCKLIPNGVDRDRFCPGAARRQDFGLPNDRTIVLMVSALIPTKRVSVGIEAVHQIPDAHLVVAGDGPLRNEIDLAAAKMLPGRFTRLSVSPTQMHLLYRSADVFLHLSKDEPFGNVFLEAMACGLPIVAHNSQRSRWIVGDDEFLADTDSPLAISDQIKLARTSSSAQAQNRAKKADAFSWNKIGSMYRQFLEEIVASRPPRNA
jgi:glycosyltransferase involved in cell wall biosynthesis